MLTLIDGTKVRILNELNSVVVVEELEPCGFDSEGEFIFQAHNISKKHHKGRLLLDGVSII